MLVVFVHLHISIYLYLYSSSPTQSAGPPQNETKIHQMKCVHIYIIAFYIHICIVVAFVHLYICIRVISLLRLISKQISQQELHIEVRPQKGSTLGTNFVQKGDTVYSQWHYFHLRFLSISDKWRKTILPSKAQHIVGLFSAILEFVYKQIPETQKGASRVCEARGFGCSGLKSFLFLN